MVKDGYKFALPPLALGAGALGLGWTWAGAALLVLGGFVLWFFRDPERAVPADPAAIVSPADGRVMEIVDETHQGHPGRRMSIFLSVFDVHVNRAPAAGTLEQVEYRPGKFLAAMQSRASVENEQNVMEFTTPGGTLVVRQIAGLIARRILCWKRPGEAVAAGERVGMIRFGSRVDLWLPPKAQILVERGRHVAGGSTIVARWK